MKKWRTGEVHCSIIPPLSTPLPNPILQRASCGLCVYRNQVVILRHSLFALAGRDVMVAGFGSVAAVTAGVLITIVAVMMGLMSAGVAQVR